MAASDAWRHWRRVPAIERGKLLHETAGLMRADRAELSRLLTLEGGKPRIENLDEVEWCAACFQYYAEIARNSHGSSIPPTAEHQINFTIKEPLGVVAAIVPFNYPLLLLVWKIAPALAAGNTVVIKPSELTPLATLRLVERAMRASAERRRQRGDRAARTSARRWWTIRDVACIAFTGSTAVGTRIAVRAAEQLKRVNLELGGIDPLIVFEDADLDIAVPGAAWARFLNNGQVCTSAKRIYVVESIAKEFVERFVEHTRSLKLGNGMDPETDLGPLISERARDACGGAGAPRAWRRARAAVGRRAACERGPGWFYAPTVLTDVQPTRHRRVRGSVRADRVDPGRQGRRRRDRARGRASDFGLGANIYTQQPDLGAARRCRRSRPARSGSTIRSPTTTPRRLAACGRAAWAASSARKDSTHSARPSTCTSTSCPNERRSGSRTASAARRFRSEPTIGTTPHRRRGRRGRDGPHHVRDLAETARDVEHRRSPIATAAAAHAWRGRWAGAVAWSKPMPPTAESLARRRRTRHASSSTRAITTSISRVMDAAVALGAHYCDLGGLFHVTKQQLRRHAEFKRGGLLALCGIGSAPGIVNVMARAGGAIGSTGSTRSTSPSGTRDRTRREGHGLLDTSYSILTVLDEASQPAALFTGGTLRFVEPLSGAEAVDFPQPVGRMYPGAHAALRAGDAAASRSATRASAR